jgi:O-antigen ligase
MVDGILFVAEILLYFLAIMYIVMKQVSKVYVLKLLYFFSKVHCFFILLQKFVPSVFYPIIKAMSGTTMYNVVYSNELNGVYMGATGQTSTISIFLIIGFVISLYHLGRKVRLRNIIGVVIFAVGILLTNRRGTLFCAITILLLFILLNRLKINTNISMILCGLIAIYIIGYENIPGVAELTRKFSIYSSSSDFFSGRSSYWEQGIQLFLKKPWFGNGLSSFAYYVPEAYNAHNSYIEKLSDMGIIGSILFFLPYIYCLIKSTIIVVKGKIKMQFSKDSFSFVLFIFLIQVYIFMISMSEGIFEEPAVFVLIYLVQLMSFSESKRKYNKVLASNSFLFNA